MVECPARITSCDAKHFLRQCKMRNRFSISITVAFKQLFKSLICLSLCFFLPPSSTIHCCNYVALQIHFLTDDRLVTKSHKFRFSSFCGSITRELYCILVMFAYCYTFKKQIICLAVRIQFYILRTKENITIPIFDG